MVHCWLGEGVSLGFGWEGVWSLVEGKRGGDARGGGKRGGEIVIRGEDMIEGSEKFENREASRGIVDRCNINFNSYILATRYNGVVEITVKSLSIQISCY